ncbi:MAG: cytochrome c, partial [Alphaproteobacteria bacterium]|nr:cytochrome c [Alphaproteobacteria bacterium]
MWGASFATRKQDGPSRIAPHGALLAALFLFLGLTLTACSGEERTAEDPPVETESPESETPELGTGEIREPARLYAEYCASCHEGGVFKAPHVVTFQMMSPER